MIVVFDAYGTLWDVGAIETACAQVVGPEYARRLLDLWRQKQLEYAFLRTVMDRYTTFEEITASALTYALASLGLEIPATAVSQLNQAWWTPEAFADARPTLQALDGQTRAILSNGDPAMLAAGVHASGVKTYLEAVLSVAPSRRFKPHPAAYQSVCDHFGQVSRTMAFVSSNGWDIAGATHFGFRTVWVNRLGRPREELGVRPGAVIGSLRELPAALPQLFDT